MSDGDNPGLYSVIKVVNNFPNWVDRISNLHEGLWEGRGCTECQWGSTAEKCR